MPFNLSFQQACQRGKRMKQAAVDTFKATLEPFSLEKCYPPTAIQDPVTGKWRNEYVIQAPQRKLHDRKSLNGTTPKFLAWSSGVGAGKTLCFCAEMYKLLRTIPGIKIVVVTAYDYYFDEFLLPVWYRVLPEDSVHIKTQNKKSRSIVMTNGSQIRFKAYDDPDKVKGWDAHVIWIEEASELGDGNNDKAKNIWNNLLMRLRSNKPAYPPRVYLSQNPKGHNWVWQVFIKNEPAAPQPMGDTGKKTVFGKDADGNEKYFKEWEKINANGDVFYTITCPTTANSFVPPGYVSTMLGQMADTPGLRQRMVEGEWNPINTLVYDYPIYSERTHTIDYQRFLDFWDIDEIPSWWRIAVGIDCGGQRSPWAVEFYCETENGEWIGFDEIYKVGITWREIAELIKEKTERFTGSIEYWIDPISSNQKGGPTATTITDEFRDWGIPTRMPRGYNKQGGIGRVQDMLNRNKFTPCPYMDDPEGDDVDGRPTWQNGHAQLYYLTNIEHRKRDTNADGKYINPKGHAMPHNLAEKTVYRYDSTKQREPKASEEGLSPVLTEKLMDRDDHAQTAEMFFAIGIRPFIRRPDDDHGSSKRSRAEVEDVPRMYGRSRSKQRRSWG